jgi:hypothetical protein
MLKVIIPVLAGLGLAAMADGALAQGEGCLEQRTVSSQPTETPPAQPAAPTTASGGAG